MWPGVTMGHEHRTSSGQILKTVSLQPLVFSIEDFVRLFLDYCCILAGCMQLFLHLVGMLIGLFVADLQ